MTASAVARLTKPFIVLGELRLYMALNMRFK